MMEMGTVAAYCGGGGGKAPTQMPPVKNSGGQKGQNDLFDQKGKMVPLTPGILDWGHLRRHPAPRNPPPLAG